jgi:hypothetical protein
MRHLSRLHPLEYGWLLLPLPFAFLAFPLARVVLAGIAFVWVAALLFQRQRGVGYVRALLMAALMMILWTGICALLTGLANGLFQWAGENIAHQTYMVTSVLMLSFAVYGVAAVLAVRLLRIGTWCDAGILLLALMGMASGAVLASTLESLWAFPVATAMAVIVVAFSLRSGVKLA